MQNSDWRFGGPESGEGFMACHQRRQVRMLDADSCEMYINVWDDNT
jgi:hypothetical protein